MDIDGILAMMTDVDILTLRDGKIAATRSYRKGRV